MGPSGSGKSTLLTLAGGLDHADRPGRSSSKGRALADARPADSSPRLRRRSVGYVFQDFNLIPALTAAENVALPRELDGVGRRRGRARRLVVALEELDVGELADRFPDDMSGGQQQRVAIARALVGDRRWSSPTSPPARWTPRPASPSFALLRSRCDAGAAGVLVTHEARLAAWADRIVFLRDGLMVDDTGVLAGAESLLDGANR